MQSDFPHFFGAHPSLQNAIDLFKGEWSTRLPDDSGLVASTGPARHCEDYRVSWAARELQGFSGKMILELGPLEGGHAYMLEQLGADEIVSVEANSRAYLKCLILKEAFGLARSRFLLGDFMPFLRASRAQYDVGFACGVLYHQPEPVELIQLLATRCESVFVWTHFHDSAYLATNSKAAACFDASRASVVGGFEHTLFPRRYDSARSWKGFCGGGESSACWLSQTTILAAFEYFGFSVGRTVVEENPNGPAIMFTAKRRKPLGAPLN
jgi:hypothetical protein